MYEGVVFVKIAVCDDDSQVLLRVLSKLAAYREQRQADLPCQGFENAVDLLASMERENYDLLFLDVLMPGLSGIQAAREIRQKNENIKIVFLTSSPEYAVESYSVQATNYLLKPATEERLFPRIGSACRFAAKTGRGAYHPDTGQRVPFALWENRIYRSDIKDSLFLFGKRQCQANMRQPVRL